MTEAVFAVMALILIAAVVLLIVRLAAQGRALRELSDRLGASLEEKHRSMLVDLHDGLASRPSGWLPP